MATMKIESNLEGAPAKIPTSEGQRDLPEDMWKCLWTAGRGERRVVGHAA